MAVKISNKLNNAFEGALAGGGDPATSPLYVFGPFLKLIVVAGVAIGGLSLQLYVGFCFEGLSSYSFFKWG